MEKAADHEASGKPGETAKATSTGSNFIREAVQADLASKKYQAIVTRFPPEPNGYLHIGHAKSICLNFGLAKEFNGTCHLRFDDTNPTTEDVEYVESIQRDVRWLGFDWGQNLFFTSDYFEKLYAFGIQLIEAGKAYVCSLSEEDIRKYRGTAYEPGIPSPYRDRSVEENLDLFKRMRAGEFPDGAHVLRAKIDMASPNLKMRDWPLYRIRHAHHHRTGDTWCLYPLYDFAHCLSDYIENITHSICTLEFENNRELYDWIIEAVGGRDPNRPHQTEFARLNITYTLMSKRKLLELVGSGRVTGWDDPRMPTIAGMRRRGYTPEAIRELCERVGVAKNNSVIELALLEHVLREDLNRRSRRVLCVLKPLRLVIEDYPEGKVEEIDAPYWPAELGLDETRKVPFSREVYIDRDDFLENPPKDFYRLSPGREVRLRHGYVVKCTSVVKDDKGEIVELRCTHDPATLGKDPEGRKVKGTVQWVSAPHAREVEVRLYDRLFTTELPGANGDALADLDPASLVTITNALVEPVLHGAVAGDRFQFERLGYFFVDPIDSKPGAPIFNRTVALKDTWGKATKAPTPVAPSKESARTEPVAPATATATKGENKSAVEQDPEVIRLRDSHGLSNDDARILAGDPALAGFFTDAIATHANAKVVANWVVNEVKDATGLLFDGAALGELVKLIDAGTISGKIAKEVLAEMRKSGGKPSEIVSRLGIEQITNEGAIETAVDAVLAESPDVVARYRAGNANLIGALVGLVMKKTGGRANPKVLNEMLKKKLS